tara:strand:- start:5007 stop:6320 length:1314 start_codon:yes stop_codon:yes gene_type:complete
MPVQIKGVGSIDGLDQGLDVGIVTATSFVGTGVSVVGVVTATSFVGSGANLTSLPAQATIANNADNRVITGGSGVNLNGEANLTFDGSTFAITGGVTATTLSTFSASGSALRLNDGSILRLGNADADFFLYHDGSSTDYISAGAGKQLRLTTDDFVIKGANNTETLMTAAKDGAVALYHNNTKRLETFDNNPFVGVSVTNDLLLNSSGDSAVRWAVGGNASSNFKWSMYYSSSGSSLNIFDNVNSRNMASFKETGAIELNYGSSKKLETTNTGVTVTGNLAFSSGSGIDFSATGDSSGTMSSELLDDYEEGSWTPSFSQGFSIQNYNSTYTKVGRLVTAYCYVRILGNFSGNNNRFQINGLPFNAKNVSYYHGGGFIGYMKNSNYGYPLLPLIGGSTSYIYLHRQDGTNVAWTYADMHNIGNGYNGEFMVTVVYETA